MMRPAVSSSIPERVCSLVLEAALMFTGLSGVDRPCFTPSAMALVCFAASLASFFNSTAATLLPSLICSVALAASCLVFSVSCWLQAESSRRGTASAAAIINFIRVLLRSWYVSSYISQHVQNQDDDQD